MYNETQNVCFDNNAGYGFDDGFTREEGLGQSCGCHGDNIVSCSSTDKLCRTIRNSEASSGKIIGEACKEYNKIKCRQNDSNTNLLCRANKAAEEASAKILREACQQFSKIGCGCCCNTESASDILCRLNRQAECASRAILEQTCKEYSQNKCNNNETTTEILCRLNKQSEEESRKLLSETCRPSCIGGGNCGGNSGGCCNKPNWHYDNCNCSCGNQWNEWYNWYRWYQWYQYNNQCKCNQYNQCKYNQCNKCCD